MTKLSNYNPVIGLEIHVELKTKSKMFCQCVADYFGKEPNTNTCPVCLGLPGALPVPNKRAVEWTILIGKTLNCKINSVSKFDRKHYFYPDLPKGYQISQFDEPIAVNGKVKITNLVRDNPQGLQNEPANPEGWKQFRIRRVHLEEDTGKLLHVGTDTLVDFNRSGVPLVEIVTEPDFDNSDDVKQFLEELQVIIRYLGVSDADMEKGSMRLEPNISVRNIKYQISNIKTTNQKSNNKNRFWTSQNDNLPSYKVEVKNINSFRFVKLAIDHEAERQIEILKSGETPVQETRGFDEKTGKTYSQRTKEEAHDYRYFPEPDIPPLTFSRKYIDTILVPELPQEKVERYVKLGLKFSDAFTLTRNKKSSDRFEATALKIKSQDNVKVIDIANVIINKKETANLSIEELYRKLKEFRSPKQTDEKALEISIKHLIEINKKAVEDYKKGKENAIMFLVGQVMREMKGKADPLIVKKKLIDKLSI